MSRKRTIARRNPVARALRQVKAQVVRSRKTYSGKAKHPMTAHRSERLAAA